MRSHFALLFAVLVSTHAFGQISILVDDEDLTRDLRYKYFFYPSTVRLAAKNYDSLEFKNATITYFDLVAEKMVEAPILKSEIDINPTGILSGRTDSRKKPITVKFQKVWGFKNGEKVKIDAQQKSFEIAVEGGKFFDDGLFYKVNKRSHLKLFVGDASLDGIYIDLKDSTKTFKIETPTGTRIAKGNLILLRPTAGGAAMPLRTVSITSEEELVAALSGMLKKAKPGEAVSLKGIVLIEQDGTPIKKDESLQFKFR